MIAVGDMFKNRNGWILLIVGVIDEYSDFVWFNFKSGKILHGCSDLSAHIERWYEKV